MSYRGLAVLGFLCIPWYTHAAVLFSEIAWMGTDADANNEWIEIYNFSNTPTDLTGWTITSESGSINIALAGTLQPHQVVVLERTDDSTLPSITAFQTYTGALSNDGETLTIKDQNGVVSDQAIGGLGWVSIGGINEKPKFTPQRTRTGSWLVGAPTPGAENVTENGTHQSTETNTNTNTTVNTTQTSHTSNNTGNRSGGSSRKSVPLAERVKPVLSLSLDVPKITYVNQPVSFTANPSGLGTTLTSSLVYNWNFGDTYTGTGKSTTHTYRYPGEYTVVVEGAFAKQHDVARATITVLPASLTLKRTADGSLEIHNTSSEEIDIGGYVLSGTETFTFPKYTFIKKDGTLVVPKARVQKLGATLALVDKKGARIAYDAPAPSTQTFVQSTAVPTVLSAPSTAPLSSVTKESTAEREGSAESQDSQKETIIHIGNTEEVKPGFFARVYRRITHFFGF